MPTYVYETIPDSAEQAPERFEVWQSMRDDALTKHPDTGQPVRRVITGGMGFMGLAKGNMESSGSAGGHQHSGGCCGGGCH